MNENFVSRQQLNLLSERIFYAENTAATKELEEYITNLKYEKGDTQMCIMLVGSGGSYPAALFGKYVISRKTESTDVETATPQTALEIINQCDNIAACEWHPKYDLIIGISYSGKTFDMVAVARKCVARGYRFLLLTGEQKFQVDSYYLQSDLIKVISYFSNQDTTGPERGLISMASTLAPMVILDDNPSVKLSSMYEAMLREGEEFVSNLEISEIVRSLQENPIIHIFYEWITLPTAMDIESKFIESGIANVVLHEKKNFSHGRCTVLCNQSFGMVVNLLVNHCKTDMNDSYKTNYDRMITFFLKRECKKRSAYYLEIGSESKLPRDWNISAMTKNPYLITAIGEKMGIDISRPLVPYPENADLLYKYTGNF